jgi:hypothetical protein
LLREVVLSVPFRNTQGGPVKVTTIEGPTLNISGVTSRTQDAKSHNTGEAVGKTPAPATPKR